MEKKIAGLLGAVATLGAFNAAQAAPTPSPAPSDVLRANSFAELLQPIPNAAALLQAVETFSWRSSTSVSTTTITTTIMPIDAMLRASSWCRRDTAGIITITTTIITASTAATTEVTRHPMMRKQDLKGPVFLCRIG